MELKVGESFKARVVALTPGFNEQQIKVSLRLQEGWRALSVIFHRNATEYLVEHMLNRDMPQFSLTKIGNVNTYVPWAHFASQDTEKYISQDSQVSLIVENQAESTLLIG